MNIDAEFHAAAGNGDVEKMESLLSRWGGVSNVDVRGALNRTALHVAAMNNKLDVVDMLVSSGASLDAKGKDGSTPLHLAVLNGNRAVAQVLLVEGANPLVKNNRGKLPCMYARGAAMRALLKAHTPSNVGAAPSATPVQSGGNVPGVVTSCSSQPSTLPIAASTPSLLSQPLTSQPTPNDPTLSLGPAGAQLQPTHTWLDAEDTPPPSGVPWRDNANSLNSSSVQSRAVKQRVGAMMRPELVNAIVSQGFARAEVLDVMFTLAQEGKDVSTHSVQLALLQQRSNAPSQPAPQVNTSAMDEEGMLVDNECRICMENEINTVIIPCGHVCVCDSCGAQLSTCPICRSSVSQLVKTFRS